MKKDIDFEALVRDHLKLVYYVSYKYVRNAQDAEDITQDVFLKIWKNLKKYDSKWSLKTWILGIAKNTAIDFLRKKKSIVFTDFKNAEGGNFLVDSLADSTPLQSRLLESKDTAEIFTDAIKTLSSRQQEVLFLRYNNDFTFKEIAKSLGESIDTVKSRYHRGVTTLKKLLPKI